MAGERARYGLSLPNRGVLIGVTTLPELFALAERAEASGFYDSVWVGDSLGAKPHENSSKPSEDAVADGGKLFGGLGCIACHAVPGVHPAAPPCRGSS